MLSVLTTITFFFKEFFLKPQISGLERQALEKFKKKKKIGL